MLTWVLGLAGAVLLAVGVGVDYQPLMAPGIVLVILAVLFKRG